MPGHVQVSPDGQVWGWAFQRRQPARSVQIDLLLDGRRLIRLTTAGSCDAARIWDTRATSAGFSYLLPPELSDGKVHELRARLVRGGELAGSPTVWEPRRDSAPARSFVLARDVEAPDRRKEGIPLAGGGGLRFDSRSFRSEYVGRGHQLIQNSHDVGGLPGHRRYRPWPAYIASFADHYVDASFGGVYRPQGALWQGASYLSNSFAQRATRHQIRTAKIAPAPAEPCFLLCNSVKHTYFHWHLDSLAGLVMAREQRGAGFRTLGPESLNAWQSASLALLGEVVEPTAGACRPKETLVASHIDGRGIYPDRWVLKLFNQLKRAHKGGASLRRSRGVGSRLLISRRDAGHRVLENEAELWEALRTRGFKRFVPGEATYAEQIDAFAHAEVIVASHGSALTNIGFCRPRTTVIEILPRDYLNGCFRYLAIALGLRHAWYSSDRVSPFSVDVGDFTQWCSKHHLL